VETRTDSPARTAPAEASWRGRPAPRIAILGAGAGGLCMAIQLKQAGFHDFTIFEKSDRVGGTWHDNTYPGACCDVPSHLYSFSFERKSDWSRVFSPQAEIQAYFQHCAEKYGLLPHIRFGVEIAGARFDESPEDGRSFWRLRTTAGEEIAASAVVSGLGQLNRPHVPPIAGLEDFAGTSFHSARWRHDHDLTGRHVAVIGNAASAIQFIPEIAKQAAKVHVFQRTPNWMIPRNDRAYSDAEKRRFAKLPGWEWLNRALVYWALESRFFAFRGSGRIAKQMKRMALELLEKEIPDPALRATLTPDYPIGCKRILISDDYYASLRRDNVEIVTSPIERIAADGVVTKDGRTRAADTLIFATGFETTSFLAPLEIEGLGGRKLREEWRTGAEAYLGVAVSGFPNLFLLYGPNTNLGHNSILFMIECQVNYIVRCLRELVQRERAFADVRPEAQERYNEEVQRKLASTAWNAACGSWYKTEAGKITNNWSGFTVDYWWKTRRPDFGAFRFHEAAPTRG
jgi:cation diffusion facilitator CzcD-associated flavoprotein CzcO